jgi:hypothetical protein
MKEKMERYIAYALVSGWELNLWMINKAQLLTEVLRAIHVQIFYGDRVIKKGITSVMFW